MTDLRLDHPTQLHTVAALWSLHAARHEVDVQITLERRDRAMALVEVADSLRSQTYGNRYGLGHHSDPTAGAALGGSTPERTSQRGSSRFEQLGDSVTATLQWLAGKVGAGDGPGDPLARLHAALPGIGLVVAHQLQLWLADLDGWIRRALGLAPDRKAMTGVPCPACQVRQMYRLTSSPVRHLVVCGEACPCAGDGCPCGMPVRAAGVAHIWDLAIGVVQRYTTGLPA